MKKCILFSLLLTVVLGVQAQTARKFTIYLHADSSANVVCFLPEKPSGKAIVGVPGGGYSMLSNTHEGTSWSGWLNQRGIAYFVVNYRLPNGDRTLPMSDVQNTIRMVRDSAAVWQVNPHAVGIMGFSAGGHLASVVSTHSEFDARPDFSILFYPVISMDERVSHKWSCRNFLGEEGQKDPELVKRFSTQNAVRRHLTPPAIIITASDDQLVPPVTNGIAYYSAMRKAGNECTLHVYPTGGHGFGFGPWFKYHDQMLTDLGSWLDARQTPQPDAIRVACIGNSITDGHGIDMAPAAGYPAQLQQLIGSGYWVKNFGVSGRTLLNKGDLPYMNEMAWRDAQAFKPDIVIIKLGTNDSKPQNWQHGAEFKQDLMQMITTLNPSLTQSAKKKGKKSNKANTSVQPTTGPKIYLCTPIKAFKPSWNISDSVIVNDIIPIQQEVASELGLEVIDLHTLFGDDSELMQPDGIHPNGAGVRRMMEIIAKACFPEAVSRAEADRSVLTTPGNPFLPLWEHIPDGEPYVFEDPDHPGKYRVYVYGSHDDLVTAYCGRDQVVWSAPVEDLTKWRYDGEIFSVNKNAKGELLSADGVSDVLFAPDVTLVTAPDGKKTYYLYPNNQAGGRNGMVCRSSRPDGPFEVCNWSKEKPNETDGVLRFDPAVFVDDDGRVYGYWGFERSYAAELDPATMATVKPGTQIVEDMVSGRYQEGEFRFFEASSIRKIKDKYVFIYSRFTKEGEFGLPMSNYTLAYAYSDHPMGPYTYGGTIIDGRAREKDEKGNVIASATIDGNTHGSICEINGQWYVFYHRQTGTDEYARQAMVAPIEVRVEEGKGGKVKITEGEYTSEGFSLQGLNPLERHSAGIACWYTGPKTAVHEWPNNTFYGSYVASGYGTADKLHAPYALRNNTNAVVNNTDGSIVGYKYFNFTETRGAKDLTMLLRLVPEGVGGTIDIMADSPWKSRGGQLLGSIQLKADMPKVPTDLSVSLPKLAKLTGKHAIYFRFTSGTKEKSLCTLEDFQFQCKR